MTKKVRAMILVALCFAIHVSALSCYDSDTMQGDERPLTTATCVDPAVCEYRESQQISGYVQECSNPSSCATFQADTTFWKNVICCTNDLCNAASGQPSGPSVPSPPTNGSSVPSSAIARGWKLLLIFILYGVLYKLV